MNEWAYNGWRKTQILWFAVNTCWFAPDKRQGTSPHTRWESCKIVLRYGAYLYTGRCLHIPPVWNSICNILACICWKPRWDIQYQAWEGFPLWGWYRVSIQTPIYRYNVLTSRVIKYPKYKNILSKTHLKQFLRIYSKLRELGWDN